ncbi:alpha/beta hydrolase [Mucilaginibacter pocheonensis]|uniref:Pimeloyl-ACP methyl ester carboxylesterase n=1 Tax=Mucilaginibacter pocheonensis TaxID=398050 RepID=A0ABU1T854_9SPHI|nr:alpha/beta hydrolase [Mucilaginibacter pocheonensis]MDR6941543.1 pimeloyl-ACP methyl ester carboxylesterase [Mucilaginibacter pocheonensis]
MKKGILKWAVIMLIISVCSLSRDSFGQEPKTIKNIVLVHGAFVDGSGWQAVYHILTQRGYNVSVTQHTLLSYTADVAAVNRIIDQQDGPCILVGHSYGGAVITTAGNNPKVVGLVYIAAHAPDAGESEAGNGKAYPSVYKSLIKGSDGMDYIDPKMFATDFAGEVTPDLANFMAVSQTPTADSAFHAVITKPAWKTKPVWCMVAKSDRIINPDLEWMYAKRAKSVKTVEVEGASHSVYITHPKEAADLIISATKRN